MWHLIFLRLKPQEYQCATCLSISTMQTDSGIPAVVRGVEEWTDRVTVTANRLLGPTLLRGYPVRVNHNPVDVGMSWPVRHFLEHVRETQPSHRAADEPPTCVRPRRYTGSAAAMPNLFLHSGHVGGTVRVTLWWERPLSRLEFRFPRSATGTRVHPEDKERSRLRCNPRKATAHENPSSHSATGRQVRPNRRARRTGARDRRYASSPET